MGNRLSRIGAGQEQANPLRARRGHGSRRRTRSRRAARLQALVRSRRSARRSRRAGARPRHAAFAASRAGRRARPRGQARLLRKAARADQSRRADHDSRVRARRRGARCRAQPALVALDAEARARGRGRRARPAPAPRRPFQQRALEQGFRRLAALSRGIPGRRNDRSGTARPRRVHPSGGASAARACAAARAQARARAAGHRLRDLRVRERRKRAPRHRAGDRGGVRSYNQIPRVRCNDNPRLTLPDPHMTARKRAQTKAYQDPGFLNSKDARALRILSEYLEPKSRFDHHKVDDTIVFMGSARIKSRETAEEMLRKAKDGKDRERAQTALRMSAYYEAARELATRLTTWSKELDRVERRFVVCTGGGPGIMEAANRGAAEAKGLNVGLTISIPAEEFDNPYVTRELSFHFHYFFMRKFWFAYLAKAVIVFPGGYGTLDELFELLTLVQTHKMRKPMPIVLFGTEYWREVIDFDALARHGTIDAEDIGLVHRTDSVDDAYEWIVAQLAEKALAQPGATL